MKKKIIIVNEDEYFVITLTKYLRSKGFDARSFLDGGEGIKSAKSAAPDLVILDYEMTKIDGLSIAKLLKSDSETKDIPIFMFVPDLDESEFERLSSAGVKEYITRPFDPLMFLKSINEFFDLTREEDPETQSTDKSEIKRADVMLIEGYSSDPSGLEDILHEGVFKINVMNSLKEGLGFLSQNHIDLIFLDKGINNNTGIEICRAIKKHKKLRSIPVIILAKALDIDAEFQAIAAGASYVLKKPLRGKKQIAQLKIAEILEESALRGGVKGEYKNHLLERWSKEKVFDIDQLIMRVRNLTTTPFIVMKVNSLVANPNTRLAGLVKVVEADQALTSRILKLINSPYYGLRRKIRSIKSAITYIGFDATKNITQAIAAYEFLTNKDSMKVFDRDLFWAHCLGVATHAKQVAKATAFEYPEDSFIAGLLHDVGKTVLSEHAQESFFEAYVYAENEKIPLHEAEKCIFGSTHALCGREFVEKWRMPKAIIETAEHHHKSISDIQNDQRIIEKSIVLAVKLGNSLCKARLLGFSGNSFVYEPLEKITDVLDIDQFKFERILKQGMNELENFYSHVFMNEKKIAKHSLLADNLCSLRDSKEIVLISTKPNLNLFSVILRNAGYNLIQLKLGSDFSRELQGIDDSIPVIINFDSDKKDLALEVVDVIAMIASAQTGKSSLKIGDIKDQSKVRRFNMLSWEKRPVIAVGNTLVKQLLKRAMNDSFTFFSFPIDPEAFLETIDKLTLEMD